MKELECSAAVEGQRRDTDREEGEGEERVSRYSTPFTVTLCWREAGRPSDREGEG